VDKTKKQLDVTQTGGGGFGGFCLVGGGTSLTFSFWGWGCRGGSAVIVGLGFRGALKKRNQGPARKQKKEKKVHSKNVKTQKAILKRSNPINKVTGHFCQRKKIIIN